MIDVALLRALGASQSAAALYAPLFDQICPLWEVDEPTEVAGLLATVAHETTNASTGLRFDAFVENLNYSAQGLANTWARFSETGKRGGPPNALATRLHRRPEQIANVVYAGRYGNGDENSGDGWRYRGRGGIQCTFYDNYVALRDATGVDVVNEPDRLLEPEGIVVSACWFWKAHGCNELAQRRQWIRAREVVNGGRNGLDDVLKLTETALDALGAS